MKKRRIVLWTVGFLLMVILIVAGVATAWLAHSTAEFTKFKRKHAGAEQTVTAAIRPALRLDYGKVDTSPYRTPEIKKNPDVDPAKEIAALGEDLQEDEKYRIIVQQRPFSVMRLFLTLPADDYPEEGASGPIPCGAALRRKIVEEAAMQASWRITLRNPYSDNSWTTMAAQLQPLMDRAERLLVRGNWPWPDPERDEGKMESFPVYCFSYLGQATLLRASREGDKDRAASMFVNLLRFRILNLLQQYTSPDNYIDADPIEEILLGAAGSSGLSAQGGLEEAATLLAKMRLNAQQTRELRALQVLAWERYFSHPIPGGITSRYSQDSFRGKMAMVVDAGARAALWALLSPSAKAWSEGNETEYFKSTGRVDAISRIAQKITGEGFGNFVYGPFDPESSGFSGEHSFNEEIDRLQVLVAVARYRQSEGRYPESAPDLVLRHLDRAVLERKDAAWGIARLPGGIYPIHALSITRKEFNSAVEKYRVQYHRLPKNAGELRVVGITENNVTKYQAYFIPLAERPVIFHVRRGSLRRDYLTCLQGSWSADNTYEEFLRRIKPNRDRLDILRVDAICPEPERFRPEILNLLTGNKSTAK